MTNQVKIIKKAEIASRDEYITSHELSLLSLLIDKHPEKAVILLEKRKAKITCIKPLQNSAYCDKR